MDFNDLTARPLKMKYTRIHRNYSGGLLLEQWQNNRHAADGNRPEEWAASTVKAITDGTIVNEGLSLVDLPGENDLLLQDLIRSNPEGFMGREHVAKYGTDSALLVKIIDSCKRLFIQVHPDRDYAKEVFGSNFGKTEAWYILGGRTIDGQEPYILLGFKKGITREAWKDLFEKQDVKGMENALHRFNIQQGDIYLIESGVPHALGTGCFLIEVQEPTDYTMRVERSTPEGRRLPDTFCHQGVGFSRMLDCFHYDTHTREEVLDRWHLKPQIVETQDGGTRTSIVSFQHTSCFGMEKLEVYTSFNSTKEHPFLIGVVLSGKGKLEWDGGSMNVTQADELFLPSGLKGLCWTSDGGEKLEVILCYPPK